MSLKEWPCQDQPRQKLLAHTSAMLTDAELLALILQNGSRGQTALDLARSLLRDHSQLHQLMIASWPQLSHYVGLGRAKYALLQAVAEIGRRLFIETHVLDQQITSSQAAAHYFTAKLRHMSREVLAGVFLDQDQRILSYQEFFQGTVDQLCIHPREIIKQALQCNATGLILAHNHP